MTSIRAAVASVAMGALVVTLGVANTSMAGSDHGSRDRRGRHHGPPGKFIEKNADRLGLNPEQADEIRAKFEESCAESEQLHAELREAKKKLHDLLAADLPNRDRVMKQAKRIGKLKTKAQQHKLATMLDVRQMLSKEQRQELVEIRREKRDRRFSSLREACAEDFDRHCPDLEPGRERFRCIRQNSEELSDSCREALHAKHEKRGKHKRGGKHSSCEDCEKCRHP